MFSYKFWVRKGSSSIRFEIEDVEFPARVVPCRGGSRVVQVISRNHSNVSKPAFVTPWFIGFVYWLDCHKMYKVKGKKII